MMCFRDHFLVSVQPPSVRGLTIETLSGRMYQNNLSNDIGHFETLHKTVWIYHHFNKRIHSVWYILYYSRTVGI